MSDQSKLHTDIPKVTVKQKKKTSKNKKQNKTKQKPPQTQNKPDWGCAHLVWVTFTLWLTDFHGSLLLYLTQASLLICFDIVTLSILPDNNVRPIWTTTLKLRWDRDWAGFYKSSATQTEFKNSLPLQFLQLHTFEMFHYFVSWIIYLSIKFHFLSIILIPLLLRKFTQLFVT